MLGGHVLELALHIADLGARDALVGDGDAEVEQLHVPVVRDEEVLGRDVAMHQVLVTAVVAHQLVRRVEAGAGLGNDVRDQHRLETLADRHRALEDAREVFPRHVLEDEEDLAGILPELLHLDHVGMADLRDGAGFVEEHRDEGALDDHRARERRRAGEPREENLRHPARRELTEHLVPSDPLRDHCAKAYARVSRGRRR